MPTPISQVNISLNSTSIARKAFNTALFIGTHAWFPERVRTYTSLDGADFPTDSSEYKALQAVFSQTPSLPEVKIGKRKSTATLTPINVATGTVYTVTVTVDTGASVVVSVTAGATDTEETICQAIQTQIEADAVVGPKVTTTVNGTGSAATLDISATASTDDYGISNLQNLDYAFSSSETGSTALAEIEKEDSDFYFVTADNKGETFVTELAATVNASKRVYFVSTYEQESLNTLQTPAVDILGKLKESNYDRVVGFFHQDATTAFPELAQVSRFGWEQPGKIEWYMKVLSGVAASTDPATGKRLTATQKDNLIARNANFVDTDFKVDFIRDGKTCGGATIREVTASDFLEARLNETIFNLKLNNAILPYDSTGRAVLYSTVQSELNRYITVAGSPNILNSDEPYKLDFPSVFDVSEQDKIDGIYRARFTLYQAGAIKYTQIDGTLTYKVGS